MEGHDVEMPKTTISNVQVATHIVTNDTATSSTAADTGKLAVLASEVDGTPSTSTGTVEAQAKTATLVHETAKEETPVIVMSATATPMQAVTKAVSAVLEQSAATTAVPSTTAPLQTQTIAPPRTLTLQLTPPDLGTVSVTMHLAGQSLDVQLSVSDKTTLGTITRDRDTLSKAVTDQGYDLRTLAIHGTDAGSSASSGDSNSGARDSSNNQSQGGTDRQASQSGNNTGQNAGNGAGSGGGSNGAGQRGSQSQRISSDETQRVPADPGAGALFV